MTTGNGAPLNIRIDNQTTIKTLRNDRSQPAQYLINEIKHNLATLHHNESDCEDVLPKRTPHMKSKGNETVDELSKEAAEHGSSDRRQLPQPIRNPATNRRTNQARPQEVVEEIQGIQAHHSHRPNLPSPSFIKATQDLNRRQISVQAQMCIGHVALNKHLHKIHRSDSSKCPHCPNVGEDVKHLLFHCWKYAALRNQLRLMLQRNAYSIQYVLSDRSVIRHALNYLNKTERPTVISARS